MQRFLAAQGGAAPKSNNLAMTQVTDFEARRVRIFNLRALACMDACGRPRREQAVEVVEPRLEQAAEVVDRVGNKRSREILEGFIRQSMTQPEAVNEFQHGRSL